MTNFYSDLYEKLYKVGYHDNLNFSHTPKLYPILKQFVPPGSKILDIGCSHGLAVSQIRELGYDCFGIDVAPTAIHACIQRGVGKYCTIQSITETKFSNECFDALISTDMIEHLLPEDVDTAIAEMARIVKSYCIFAIACDKEGGTQHLARVKQTFKAYENLDALHTCLQTPDEWDACFAKHGLVVEHVISSNAGEHQAVYKKQ